ncbi:hypothetical protein [Thermofilum sp.]|uniref:hypothetical protein n=1 Tax=Thermofilum sp. TaxID=1961369 RepID=UPI00316A87C6
MSPAESISLMANISLFVSGLPVLAVSQTRMSIMAHVLSPARPHIPLVSQLYIRTGCSNAITRRYVNTTRQVSIRS